MSDKKRVINLFIGPALFALCCIFLPDSVFRSLAVKSAIGTVIWLAYWWVTRPVDLAVTALLPIAINAFIPMASMSSVIANYFSETIVMLFGSSILAVSMEETGLDKRIASKILSVIGNNQRLQLVFWFLLSAFLSAILPNAVVCASIIPLAVSMIHFSGEKEIQESKIGSKLLLYIVYGVGVGGLFSPLGGAMNLVAVDYLQQVSGKEFMYWTWVVRFLPIMIVLIISHVVFMLRDVNKHDILNKSKMYFIQEYRKMPGMSKAETFSLILFSAATIFSFTRPLYQDILPGLKPAYVFIVCAILSFLITDGNRNYVMKWKIVQRKIVWDLIFVFAGGLAVGGLINSSGAAVVIGSIVSNTSLSGGIFTVFVIITVTIVLSDVTSNTATASVVLPIIVSTANGLGINPVPWIYIATIGINLSHCLPTSIRAVPVGYGLDPKYMLREGLKLNIITVVLMTLVSYVLLRFVPAFSAA